jgi:hypothetical protein
MMTRILTAGALGVLLLGATAQRSGAWSDADHREYLTFSGAVAIPGAVLPAGTYIFEVPTSSFSNSVLTVRSRDGRKVYLTQFTRIVNRNAEPGQHVTFHETARGQAPQIDVWFPMRGDSGRQLVY